MKNTLLGDSPTERQQQSMVAHMGHSIQSVSPWSHFTSLCGYFALFLFTFCDFVVVLCPFVDISHLIRVQILHSTRELAKVLWFLGPSKDYGGPQGTST